MHSKDMLICHKQTHKHHLHEPPSHLLRWPAPKCTPLDTPCEGGAAPRARPPPPCPRATGRHRRRWRRWRDGWPRRRGGGGSAGACSPPPRRARRAEPWSSAVSKRARGKRDWLTLHRRAQRQTQGVPPFAPLIDFLARPTNRPITSRTLMTTCASRLLLLPWLLAR